MTVDVWETELINIDREILYTYHEELKIQILGLGVKLNYVKWVEHGLNRLVVLTMFHQ